MHFRKTFIPWSKSICAFVFERDIKKQIHFNKSVALHALDKVFGATYQNPKQLHMHAILIYARLYIRMPEQIFHVLYNRLTDFYRQNIK